MSRIPTPKTLTWVGAQASLEVMRSYLLTITLLLTACEPQMRYIDLKEVRGNSVPKSAVPTHQELPAELSYCAPQLPYFHPESAPTHFPMQVLVDTSVTAREDALRIYDAAVRWNDEIGTEVFVTVFTEHAEMQNICNTAWVSAEDYELGGTTIGLTSSVACSRDRVLIDTENTDGTPYTGLLALDLITHELGHVLGLAHEEDLTHSVMKPSVGEADLEISGRSKCLVRIAEFLAK